MTLIFNLILASIIICLTEKRQNNTNSKICKIQCYKYADHKGSKASMLFTLA